jgi:NADPH:quinone reductase-like Zn-dependent oxidoreductase
MKAIVYAKYGPPDVLELKDVEKPDPKDDEVLVRIHAAAANPLDHHGMKGPPLLIRLVLPLFGLGMGLRKPKNPRLGADIAGRVEAVGRNVHQFRPGDEVFGVCGGDKGGFAEYACAPETRLALKPTNRSFEEAAAVPVAAITALQGLRDKGHIHSGQKVLVNGASGGVGTFAVQIAKSFGTDVTGVCSTRNLEMVRSIGADHVIDYTKEDFTRNGQRYDLIYDVVGNHSISDYKRALKPEGICVVAGFGFPSPDMSRLFEHMVLGPLLPRTENKKVGSMGIAKINHQDLSYMKELMEAGKVVPVIDKRYPLSETAAAMRHLGEGHARGKIVVVMESR